MLAKPPGERITLQRKPRNWRTCNAPSEHASPSSRPRGAETRPIIASHRRSVSGVAGLKPQKSRTSYRVIALATVVVEALAAHAAAFGAGEHRLVFHTQGRPVGRAMASKYVRLASRAAGREQATWHNFRPVLLSNGVSPALVAERLGHDVKTLLVTYAHVIRADDDRVRSIVDAALGASAEDFLRTETG
jgi:hypothetical protein